MLFSFAFSDGAAGMLTIEESSAAVTVSSWKRFVSFGKNVSQALSSRPVG